MDIKIVMGATEEIPSASPSQTDKRQQQELYENGRDKEDAGDLNALAKAYCKRGKIDEENGALDKAMADYDTAIEYAPHNAHAYYDRGNLKNTMGDKEGAIADYNRAIQLDPNDAQAYERRGFALRSQKKYNEAIADYSKSLELKADADTFAKRGYTYVTNLQEYEKGIADYEQALKINPNDSDTQQRLLYARQALEAKKAQPPSPETTNSSGTSGSQWDTGEKLGRMFGDWVAKKAFSHDESKSQAQNGRHWEQCNCCHGSGKQRAAPYTDGIFSPGYQKNWMGGYEVNCECCGGKGGGWANN